MALRARLIGARIRGFYEGFQHFADLRPELIKLSRYLGWLLATAPIQQRLQRQIPAGGPSDDERAKGKTLLWGQAEDLNGNRVESRMTAPEGYTTTALAALNIMQKILDGNFTPGFQTPARAYGADLILEIDGVARQDVV